MRFGDPAPTPMAVRAILRALDRDHHLAPWIDFCLQYPYISDAQRDRYFCLCHLFAPLPGWLRFYPHIWGLPLSFLKNHIRYDIREIVTLGDTRF